MSAQSFLVSRGSNYGPHARKMVWRSRPGAQTNAARAHYAERVTANPERPARNSARTPRGRANLLASIRRGLLGFAGLASHSGRSSVPFHRACSGTEDPSNCAQQAPPLRYYRVEIPLTKPRVYGRKRAVSNRFRENLWETWILAEGSGKPQGPLKQGIPESPVSNDNQRTYSYLRPTSGSTLVARSAGM